MRKFIQNQKLRSILSTLRPWAGGLLLVAILQLSGAMSSVSFVAQTALMKTGVMDISTTQHDGDAAAFDYDFSLKDLNGKTVDVKALRGKVIFLNMWATWCGPCRAEMPSIQKLYESIDPGEVAFVMLSIDIADNYPKVEKYVREKGFTFPVYVPADFLPKQLQVSSIPTTFVIGKDGKVKTKKVGTANYDTDEFRTFLRGLAGD